MSANRSATEPPQLDNRFYRRYVCILFTLEASLEEVQSKSLEHSSTRMRTKTLNLLQTLSRASQILTVSTYWCLFKGILKLSFVLLGQVELSHVVDYTVMFTCSVFGVPALHTAYMQAATFSRTSLAIEGKAYLSSIQCLADQFMIAMFIFTTQKSIDISNLLHSVQQFPHPIIFMPMGSSLSKLLAQHPAPL